MNDLSSIKNEMVSSGYPELRDTHIEIRYFHSKDAYLEFTRNDRSSYIIEVDKSLRKVNPLIVKGGIAHELSHILKETKMGETISLLEGLLNYVLPFYVAYDERWADKEAVKRGYGPELLEFTRYADKTRGRKYTPLDGLTAKELTIMMKI